MATAEVAKAAPACSKADSDPLLIFMDDVMTEWLQHLAMAPEA